LGRGNSTFAWLDILFENIHAETPTTAAVIVSRYAVSFMIDVFFHVSVRKSFLAVSKDSFMVEFTRPLCSALPNLWHAPGQMSDLHNAKSAASSAVQCALKR
jgi:hypothetical protein